MGDPNLDPILRMFLETEDFNVWLDGWYGWYGWYAKCSDI